MLARQRDAATSPMGLRLRRLAAERGAEARVILAEASRRAREAHPEAHEGPCGIDHEDALLEQVDAVEKERHG